MSDDSKYKLILGAAGGKDENAVTVDIEPKHHPDLVRDLNRVPWPFNDNRFREVICHHVIEHLNDLSPIMKELHRVCHPEGYIYIEVPHYSSWLANSPDHKMRFSYFSLNAYVADEKPTSTLTDFKFKVLEHRITFHRAYRRYLFHLLWNRYPKTYERFWTYVMPAEHLIFKLQPIK